MEHLVCARPHSSQSQEADVDRDGRLALQESISYWQDRLSSITRPSARAMLAKLDRTNLTGVDTSQKGVSTSKDSLYQFLLGIKQQHPRKIALVRVGDFYETWGFDAVMLVEHAGLNPMGQKLPRAGCPKVNVQRTLDDLTARGLSVVVCEEAPTPYAYGARSKRKTRFISGIVTPHSPVYVYDLVSTSASSSSSALRSVDPEFKSTPPVIGIASRKGAFTIALMDVDLRQIVTYQSMPEEIAAHIISSNGFSPPVYIHSSFSPTPAAGGTDSYAGRKVSAILQDTYKVKIRGEPFESRFVEAVRADLDIDKSVEFTDVSSKVSDRPLPLYNMTAQSIGLGGASSTASSAGRARLSLISSALPLDAPAACKYFLMRYLLHPPPKGVAMAVQSSCQRMLGVQQSLPVLPLLPPHKIAKLVGAREANHVLFSDLLFMMKGIRRVFENGELSHALTPLLEVASLNVGHNFSREILEDVCGATIAEIESVIDVGSLWETNGNGADEDGGSEYEDSYTGAPSRAQIDRAFSSLVSANERSISTVHHSQIPHEISSVIKAREGLLEALSRDMEPAMEDALRGNYPRHRPPRVAYDMINNSISLRGGKLSADVVRRNNLLHPADRNGSRLSDRYSTEGVEMALNAYRLACYELDAAVRDALKDLADKVQPHMRHIIFLSHFALVAKTFWFHVTEGTKKGWKLPSLSTYDGGGDPAERTLELDNFWPFWMESTDNSTVKNSVKIDKMVLLTGPNMAGKSTVIRSICAVSLLANCGMLAPCKSANVPYFDAYILRSAESTDSPEDKMSTFAVEMSDARAILRDASSRSLVFVDELCKGTEAQAGTAIAAATVERLANQSCLGLFATHLHDILKLPLNQSNMSFMAMETVPVDDDECDASESQSVTADWRRKTTWRIVPGTCMETLAFQVAEEYGVPTEIVQRAYDLSVVSAGHSLAEEKPPRLQSKPEPAAERKQGATGEPTFERGLQFMKGVVKAFEEESNNSASVQILTTGEVPPPSSIGFSCVYLLVTSDGKYYVGESDNIGQRFNQHQKAQKDGLLHFGFFKLPQPGGKSLARAIEAQSIRKLHDSGFPMLSYADGFHTNFAAARRE